MNPDHGPDCYACTDPAGAARQIAAERAELDAAAEASRQHRAEGERARTTSMKHLLAGDHTESDREQAVMLHHLQAANAIACKVQVGRAHFARVEAAHPALTKEGAA